MGCVSSTLLENDDVHIVGPNLIGHHIVSLTSTTYGLLTTLDQPSPPQPQTLEIINSWELMAGLDPAGAAPKLDSFAPLCPPAGGDSLVLYTTTLRGIRKTFEDCNAVRAAIEATGVAFKERDVSMDLGFREELRRLLRSADGSDSNWSYSVPQVFVKGRHIGGAEAVMRIHEEGGLRELLEGLPRASGGNRACDGCGGVRFLPCFTCCGSRKLVAKGYDSNNTKGNCKGKGKVVRCGECNENGLVLCPICS